MGDIALQYDSPPDFDDMTAPSSPVTDKASRHGPPSFADSAIDPLGVCTRARREAFRRTCCENARLTDHSSIEYLRAYPYTYTRKQLTFSERATRAFDHFRYALGFNVLWPLEQAALLSVGVTVTLLVGCGLMYFLSLLRASLNSPE